MFAMFGATVLVPLDPGQSVWVADEYPNDAAVRGFGEPLLFHFLTKMKVPAFLGSSFAFLGGFSAVSNLDSGIFANMTGEEKLP